MIIFFYIEKQLCVKAFTVLENSYCKGTYGSKYSSLDKAQKFCEGDARCFGVRDNNYGQTNVDQSKRYQRCTVNKNEERFTSVTKRAVYVKGIEPFQNFYFSYILMDIKKIIIFIFI